MGGGRAERRGYMKKGLRAPILLCGKVKQSGFPGLSRYEKEPGSAVVAPRLGVGA